jgi:hypothetical protein
MYKLLIFRHVCLAMFFTTIHKKPVAQYKSARHAINKERETEQSLKPARAEMLRTLTRQPLVDVKQRGAIQHGARLSAVLQATYIRVLLEALRGVQFGGPRTPISYPQSVSSSVTMYLRTTILMLMQGVSVIRFCTVSNEGRWGDSCNC